MKGLTGLLSILVIAFATGFNPIYAQTSAGCSVPTGLTATSITASSATLKWTAVSGAKRYVVEYGITGASSAVYDTVSVDSLVLTGLPDTTYVLFEVNALCSDTASSGYSSYYYFETTLSTTATCSVPTGLTEAGITASSATLKWSAVSGAAGYVVAYEKYGASGWSYDTVTVDSLVLKGLADTSYYLFEVETICSATSSSSYSSYVYFKTLGTTTTTCSTPTGLSAGSITTSSATLKWTAVSGAKRYIVGYEKYGSTSFTYDTVSVDSLALSGLADSTYYIFEVKSLCSDTSSSSFSSTYYFKTLGTTTTTCSTPTGLTATGITTSSATLKWSAVSGAAGYVVAYEKYGASSWSYDTVTVDSLVLKGLADTSYYIFEVETICSHTSSSSYSSYVYFKTLGTTTTTCSTPTGLTATGITASSATVKWTAVSSAKRYIVGYEKYGSTSFTYDTVSVDSLVLTGLADSTYYIVEVKSLCSDTSSSSFSSTYYFKTLGTGTACSAPTGLTATAVTASSATLKWTAVSGASGYVVAYEKYGASGWSYDTVTVDSLVLKGLADTSYYIFEVETICSHTSSSSYSSYVYFKTTGTTSTCYAPTGLGAGSITTSSATLKWSAVSGASGYIVSYASSSTTKVTDTVTTDSLAISGLSAGTYYVFYVETICSGGGTSSYTESHFTTDSSYTATCPVPTGLTTASITTSSATLKWSAVSGAAGYVVAYHKYGAATWSYDTVSVDSLVLSGLADSTYYIFEVKTLCSSTSSSSYSSYTYFKTSGTATTCSAPMGLTAVSITKSSATLKWYAVSGASGYIVSYASSSTTKVTDTVTTDSLAISGLSTGAYYVFYVETICSGGSTSSYTESHFTTDSSYTATCPVPTGLSAVATTSSATLKWSSVSGAIGYVVAYEKYGASSWSYDTVSVDSLVLTGLVDSSYYFFEVKTLCSATASSSYSSYTYFKTKSGSTSTCSAPEHLYATSITTSSATLTWSAVSGASGYIVIYASSGSKVIDTVTGDSLAISGLSADTYYAFYVETICSGGSTSSYSSSSFTTHYTTTYCYAPSDLTATSVTSSSATLKWSSVSGAKGYIVVYGKYGGTAVYDTTTADSLVLTGLSEGTYYGFYVETICSSTSISGESAGSTFTTKGGCPAPYYITASTTSSTATIKWSASSGTTGFVVAYRTYGSVTWLYDTTYSADSVVLSGLIAGTYYQYEVQSLCSATSSSSFSSVAYFETAKTTAVTCPVVADLTVTDITTGSAVIKWHAASGAVSYVVAYAKYGSSSWTIDTTTADSILIAGLSSGTYYEYLVKTLCDSGYAYSSTSTFTTTVGFTCPAPYDETVTNISDSSATITWKVDSGAAGFLVEYRIYGSSTWSYGVATADSFVVTGLSSSTVYQYIVISGCADTTYSSSTATKTFETGAKTSGCSEATGITVTSTTYSSATVKWSAASGAKSYVVFYSKYGSGTWALDTTTSDSLVLTGLTSGSYYEYLVKTLCSGGYSYSSTYYFKTVSEPTCAAPTEVTAADITSSSATIKWDDTSSGATFIVGYRLYGSVTWIDSITTGDSLVINGLSANTYYQYDVEAICSDSTYSSYSTTKYLKTSDTGGTHRMANPQSSSGTPGDGESIIVYPNPSNDQFTIAYKLTASQPVTVIISNYMGQTVSTIVSNEVQNEGSHQYSFTPQAAGMYFVRIEMGSNVIIKKIIRL